MLWAKWPEGSWLHDNDEALWGEWTTTNGMLPDTEVIVTATSSSPSIFIFSGSDRKDPESHALPTFTSTSDLTSGSKGKASPLFVLLQMFKFFSFKGALCLFLMGDLSRCKLDLMISKGDFLPLCFLGDLSFPLASKFSLSTDFALLAWSEESARNWQSRLPDLWLFDAATVSPSTSSKLQLPLLPLLLLLSFFDAKFRADAYSRFLSGENPCLVTWMGRLTLRTDGWSCRW